MEAQRTEDPKVRLVHAPRTAFSTEDWYMALSTNCRLTLLTKISKTTMHLVPSAMSTHVAQCWRCPLGMTVHLDGPRSIMGIWWLLTTPTKTKKNSSVLIEIRRSSLAPRQTRVVPWCTLICQMHVWRKFAVWSTCFRSRVYLRCLHQVRERMALIVFQHEH